MKTVRCYSAFLSLLCISIFSAPPAVFAENGWFMTVYGARHTDNKLLDIYAPKFEDSEMAAVTVGRTLWIIGKSLTVEAEGQFVKHFGEEIECECDVCSDPNLISLSGRTHENRSRKRQNHEEINAVMILRWHRFPWNRYLKTTFAFGEGISFATREPAVEMDHHAETHGLDDEVSQFLNYLMFEITAAPPKAEHWAAFIRVHHRSGIYGLINDVNGGSNYMGAGLRYDF